jgi:hypothetical protein
VGLSADGEYARGQALKYVGGWLSYAPGADLAFVCTGSRPLTAQLADVLQGQFVTAVDMGYSSAAAGCPYRSGERTRLEEAAELLAAGGDGAALLATVGPDRRIAVARELTKVFEEVRRETVSQALAHFRATAPRGEFTLVVQGYVEQAQDRASNDAVQERLDELLAAGASPAAAARQAAQELGLPRREVYKKLMERGRA